MFNKVTEFEKIIAEFYNADYAVATDSCTHAIELCLRIAKPKHTSCPKNTYLSIPMTLEKLNLNWQFNNSQWKEYYYLENTKIIDAAVLWRKNSYIPGTLMCLSFQYQKHLSLGRGGMILLDDESMYRDLVKLSYDGRDRGVPWIDQAIDSIGYHYYMTPETAILGLKKFKVASKNPSKEKSFLDYPDLSKLPAFQKILFNKF